MAQMRRGLGLEGDIAVMAGPDRGRFQCCGGQAVEVAPGGVDGRIVGGWFQRPGGEVALTLLDDVGRDGRAALEVEAQRLTAWLRGDVVGSVYHSPLSREAMARA